MSESVAPVDYELAVAQARELFRDERDPIANAANAAALIMHSFPDLNWSGFYFVRDRMLVLGPFEGKPATTRIAFGKGVCGTAWEREETIVVPDVHAFAGHIACDSASNAEIVVPIIVGERVVGVLDCDSPLIDRFSAADRAALEAIAALVAEGSDFP
jgi:GAF domain-containing protein